MKKLSIQLFVGILVVCVLVAAGVWVQASTAARPDPASYPMQEIQSIAEQSLPLVVQGLSSAPGDYHFTDRSEVQRLILGPPIMIYGLNQTTLDASFSGNARTYFDHGTAVHYPLLLDGRTRAYLTVENTGGSWKLGEFGYMDWPWDQLIAKRAELSQQRISDQVDFRLYYQALSSPCMTTKVEPTCCHSVTIMRIFHSLVQRPNPKCTHWRIYYP